MLFRPGNYALEQRFGFDETGLARLRRTGQLRQDFLGGCRGIAPLVAVRAMSQVGVHQQVAPTRIHQSQKQFGYFFVRESRLQLARDRAARACQFLLTFARSNRTFDVAAIGFRLPFDQRTQFFEDVFEYFRVTVVVFDDAFQQFVYAVPDLAIDTDPDVLRVTQLRQLVQHLDRRVRAFRVVVEEFRVFRGEFVERQLQPFHPAANTLGEQLVLFDRIDQVLHDIEGVVHFFAERFLAAVSCLQHFHQARLQAAVRHRRIAEFGLDLRDRLQDVVGVVALIRRRVGGRELHFFGRALHPPRTPAEVQQFARGLIDLCRAAFLVWRKRIERAARRC